MKSILLLLSVSIFSIATLGATHVTETKEIETKKAKIQEQEVTPALPVPVLVDASGDAGYVKALSKCSDFKTETQTCFISYEGEMRGQCEVCHEDRSCFISLEGKARSLCEAYKENKSCFVAFNNAVDRSWCEHFRDKKPCDEAFSLSFKAERGRCARGEIPRDHYFWLN